MIKFLNGTINVKKIQFFKNVCFYIKCLFEIKEFLYIKFNNIKKTLVLNCH
jgi:hypothetical protein